MSEALDIPDTASNLPIVRSIELSRSQMTESYEAVLRYARSLLGSGLRVARPAEGAQHCRKRGHDRTCKEVDGFEVLATQDP